MRKILAIASFALLFSASLSFAQSIEEHLIAGEAYFARNLLEEALREFSAALTTERRNARALSGICAVYGELAKYDQALQYCRKAVDADPQDSDAHYRLGIIFGSLGNFFDSKKCFLKAIALNPDFYDAYYNLAVAHWHSKQFDDAIINFKTYFELFPALQNALVQPGVYANLNQNFLKEAESCQKIYPGPLARAYPFNNIGIQQALLGKISEAVSSFKKAIELSPEFAYPYANLGTLSYALGESEAAIRYVNDAAKRDPFFNALPQQPLLLANGKPRFFPTMSCREQLMDFYIYPAVADAYHNLGIIYCHQGQRKSAENQLKELKKFGSYPLTAHLEQCLETLK